MLSSSGEALPRTSQGVPHHPRMSRVPVAASSREHCTYAAAGAALGLGSLYRPVDSAGDVPARPLRRHRVAGAYSRTRAHPMPPLARWPPDVHSLLLRHHPIRIPTLLSIAPSHEITD